MATLTVLPGKFLLVDLITSGGPYVATVPDIWIHDGNKCWYPKSRGEVASVKRETPKQNWDVYSCVIRKEFNSYEASRAREQQASIQSDINSESEAQKTAAMGRGLRNRTATKRYLPETDPSEDTSSDESSVGMYGPTQPQTFVTPQIPVGLAANVVTEVSYAAQQSGQSYSDSVVVTQQSHALPMNYTSAPTGPRAAEQIFGSQSQYVQHGGSLPAQVSQSAFPLNTMGTQNQGQRCVSDGTQRMNIPDPTNEMNEGSKAVVGKLVREVLKLQENISNMMLKLISIENKMENMLQPSAPQTEERVVDQEFMVEPLKEMEDVKALENALLDPDNYYQLVGMIRSLGGGSVSGALKRAWCRVFSIKVMAHVNWGGKPNTKFAKKGLKHSIITKVVFEGVRLGGRKANDFEFETETKKIMKNMPEKYRKKCAAEKAGELEAVNADVSGSSSGAGV